MDRKLVKEGIVRTLRKYSSREPKIVIKENKLTIDVGSHLANMNALKIRGLINSQLVVNGLTVVESRVDSPRDGTRFVFECSNMKEDTGMGPRGEVEILYDEELIGNIAKELGLDAGDVSLIAQDWEDGYFSPTDIAERNEFPKEEVERVIDKLEQYDNGPEPDDEFERTHDADDMIAHGFSPEKYEHNKYKIPAALETAARRLAKLVREVNPEITDAHQAWESANDAGEIDNVATEELQKVLSAEDFNDDEFVGAMIDDTLYDVFVSVWNEPLGECEIPAASAKDVEKAKKAMGKALVEDQDPSLSRPEELEEFWADRENQTKVLYFYQEDGDFPRDSEFQYLIGQQTYEDYINDQYWEIIDSAHTAEEAEKKAREYAEESENSNLEKDGLYVSLGQVSVLDESEDPNEDDEDGPEADSLDMGLGQKPKLKDRDDLLGEEVTPEDVMLTLDAGCISTIGGNYFGGMDHDDAHDAEVEVGRWAIEWLQNYLAEEGYEINEEETARLLTVREGQHWADELSFHFMDEQGEHIINEYGEDVVTYTPAEVIGAWEVAIDAGGWRASFWKEAFEKNIEYVQNDEQLTEAEDESRSVQEGETVRMLAGEAKGQRGTVVALSITGKYCQVEAADGQKYNLHVSEVQKVRPTMNEEKEEEVERQVEMTEEEFDKLVDEKTVSRMAKDGVTAFQDSDGSYVFTGPEAKVDAILADLTRRSEGNNVPDAHLESDYEDKTGGDDLGEAMSADWDQESRDLIGKVEDFIYDLVKNYDQLSFDIYDLKETFGEDAELAGDLAVSEGLAEFDGKQYLINDVDMKECKINEKKILLETPQEDLETLLGIDNYSQFVNKLDTLMKDKEFIDLLRKGKDDGKDEDDELAYDGPKFLPVKSLKPTQNEIDADKSLADPKWGPLTNPDTARKYLTGGNLVINGPLVVGGGNLILDGHHRWSQVFCINTEANIQVIDFPELKDATKALQKMQLVIAAELADPSKGLPSEEAGNLNLLNTDEQTVISYVKSKLTPEALKVFVEFGHADAEAVAKLVWGNVNNLPKPSSDAPSRSIMPQTGGAKDNLLKRKLPDAAKTGEVNIETPVVSATESLSFNRRTRI
jgi:hypothetical protein